MQYIKPLVAPTAEHGLLELSEPSNVQSYRDSRMNPKRSETGVASPEDCVCFSFIMSSRASAGLEAQGRNDISSNGKM